MAHCVCCSAIGQYTCIAFGVHFMQAACNLLNSTIEKSNHPQDCIKGLEIHLFSHDPFQVATVRPLKRVSCTHTPRWVWLEEMNAADLSHYLRSQMRASWLAWGELDAGLWYSPWRLPYLELASLCALSYLPAFVGKVCLFVVLSLVGLTPRHDWKWWAQAGMCQWPNHHLKWDWQRRHHSCWRLLVSFNDKHRQASQGWIFCAHLVAVIVWSAIADSAPLSLHHEKQWSACIVCAQGRVLSQFPQPYEMPWGMSACNGGTETALWKRWEFEKMNPTQFVYQSARLRWNQDSACIGLKSYADQAWAASGRFRCLSVVSASVWDSQPDLYVPRPANILVMK